MKIKLVGTKAYDVVLYMDATSSFGVKWRTDKVGGGRVLQPDYYKVNVVSVCGKTFVFFHIYACIMISEEVT